jgi:hypothetical protein
LFGQFQAGAEGAGPGRAPAQRPPLFVLGPVRWRPAAAGSMQNCGVHYDITAIVSPSFVGQEPESRLRKVFSSVPPRTASQLTPQVCMLPSYSAPCRTRPAPPRGPSTIISYPEGETGQDPGHRDGQHRPYRGAFGAPLLSSPEPEADGEDELCARNRISRIDREP